jgi:hypothetical protein
MLSASAIVCWSRGEHPGAVARILRRCLWPRVHLHCGVLLAVPYASLTFSPSSRACLPALQTELRDLEDLARKMKNALVKKKALSAMPALMTTEARKFAEL